MFEKKEVMRGNVGNVCFQHKERVDRERELVTLQKKIVSCPVRK